MHEIHFLYLIASGNNDSVYKVGISVDPNSRLRQVRATYNIPKAYIVETMDVNSRAEVFALEAALHARLKDRRVTRYGGREFFELSQSDLEWLRSLYKDNSNDFAQAKAYYGLELAAAELRNKAQALEQERQRRISHNRRHGKTYDTSPSGDLKRYKELTEKLSKGHLGKRFEVRTFTHPSLALSRQVQAKARDIIDRKNGLNFLKVCAIGLVAGAIVGATKGAEEATPSALSGGAIGFLSGILSQSARRSEERKKAKLLVESEVNARYPSMMSKTMTALLDTRGGGSFLIRDYGESASNLRNNQYAQPSVDLPSQEKIYSIFANQNYFPRVATAITIGLTIGLGIGSNSPAPTSLNNESSRLPLAQASKAQKRATHVQPILADSQRFIEHEAGSEASQKRPPLIEDPDFIHQEFMADNASTLAKYSNKRYSVAGIVDSRRDEYIKLDSRTLFGGAVYCYYRNSAEREKASLLKRNQGLVLSGLLDLTPKSNRRLRVNAYDCSLEG